VTQWWTVRHIFLWQEFLGAFCLKHCTTASCNLSSKVDSMAFLNGPTICRWWDDKSGSSMGCLITYHSAATWDTHCSAAEWCLPWISTYNSGPTECPALGHAQIRCHTARTYHPSHWNLPILIQNLIAHEYPSHENSLKLWCRVSGNGPRSFFGWGSRHATKWDSLLNAPFSWLLQYLHLWASSNALQLNVPRRFGNVY
jgi:hypothetical protein